MLRLTLQPSTIDLIAERMRRDGYISPDILVREALASLGPRSTETTQPTPPELPPSPADSPSQDEFELDLSYESVPLQENRSIDAPFVMSGKLEMIPFGGNP
jgi:hypothetical protein